MSSRALLPLLLTAVLASVLLAQRPSTAASAQVVRNPPTLIGTAACQPAPCVNAHGMTLLVSDLNTDYRADPSAFQEPEPGFHLVRMLVTVVDRSGEGDGSALEFTLKDTLGYTQYPDGGYGPQCDTAPTANLAPGGSWGPTPLCFEAGGDPHGSVTLVWEPGFDGAPVSLSLHPPVPTPALPPATPPPPAPTSTSAPEPPPTPSPTPAPPPPLAVRVTSCPQAGTTGTLRAVVTDGRQHPLRGVSVTLYAVAVGLPSVRARLTKASGEVLFRRLHPAHAGTMYLEVWKPEYASMTVTVAVI